MTPDNEWMNLKDTCTYLGINIDTLRVWRELGLKCSVIGGVKRVKKSNADQFLEQFVEVDEIDEAVRDLVI